MSAQLQDISQVSRLDLSMRAYTAATARLKAAEQELGMAFREYHQARERLIEDHGVTCDVELQPAVSAAYSAYKQDIARETGRQVVRGEA